MEDIKTGTGRKLKDGDDVAVLTLGPIGNDVEKVIAEIENENKGNSEAGIKYRTRSMMGRCQGGYCQMRIEKMIEDELGVKDTDIRYARQNSWMFTGEVRKEER